MSRPIWNPTCATCVAIAGLWHPLAFFAVEPAASSPHNESGMEAVDSGRSMPEDAPRAGPAERGVTVRRDIAFLEPDRDEKLDLYSPSGHTAASQAPAVLWIHGGGWTGGSKSARRERNVCLALADEGFVCASIDYRLGDRAWPQNLLDCRNGVRFLRAHAAELGIDPDRIAVAGGSAGAHLALMLAFTAGAPDLEPMAPYAGVLSEVRCVIDLYGPANLFERYEVGPDGERTAIRKPGGPLAVFGAESMDAEVFRIASPLTHIASTSPPVLILHGRADPTVDHRQSIELATAMAKHVVPHKLVLLDGVGHTFDLDSWRDEPLPRDVRAIVVEFLMEQFE